MAKTNKYTSINFNHIYDRNLPINSNPNNASNPIKSSSSSSSSSSSASFSYSAISAANNKSHGRMLVLTRPTPKSISIPPLLSPQPQCQSQSPRQPQQIQVQEQGRSEPGSDAISLRPLGRTWAGSPILSPVLSQEKEKEHSVLVASPKTDKFVPPHLRPGFVGREERPGPEVIRTREAGQKHIVSPGRYGNDDRPKSGGGYDRMRKGGESDLGIASRPRSSGNRPSSSG